MTKQLEWEEDESALDLSEVTEEQQVDLVCDSLDTLLTRLVAKGFNEQLAVAALFRLFVERMCELGDRETFEEVLELALEDEWEEVTIH